VLSVPVVLESKAVSPKAVFETKPPPPLLVTEVVDISNALIISNAIGNGF
jgi:hypothetical protein